MPLWGQPWGRLWGVQEDIIISSLSSSSSEAPRRSITIRKQTPRVYVEGRTQGYLLRLEAIASVNMPTEVFVFQRAPATATVGERDTFENLASPADLEEYPVGAPASGGVFYRSSVVELVFRNIDLLFQTLAEIQRELTSLIESLDQMDEFEEGDVIIDGVFTSVPSSEG